MKAKLFVGRAMDEDDRRSPDEAAFWASAALELLGKAALAQHSPVLIAEPKEDGVNILIATGLIEGEAQFVSVSASTIFKRCARAFKPFSDRDAQRFAAARNEYLHGSAVGFFAIPPTEWWARYWALAAILVTANDKTIDDLVGSDRSETVEKHLAQNAKNIEHRTEALIARASQRLAQYRTGKMTARQQKEWEAIADLTAKLSNGTGETCPACGSVGNLEGEDYTSSRREFSSEWDDQDFGDTWLVFTIPSYYFSCPVCHLVLDGYEMVVQAGLPESFEVLGEEDYDPGDYGND
jgi:hypothetical protein